MLKNVEEIQVLLSIAPFSEDQSSLAINIMESLSGVHSSRAKYSWQKNLITNKVGPVEDARSISNKYHASVSTRKRPRKNKLSQKALNSD
jgi:hypothetical protein